jgi:hypothetical protein
MIDPWPRVMHQPLEAPYRPDVKDEHIRKGAAIADGLVIWAVASAGKVLGVEEIPPPVRVSAVEAGGHCGVRGSARRLG